MAHKNRPGDNLFTGCIVALDADSGKMVWYHQSSPHDTQRLGFDRNGGV
jgi:alcohol dehydrogenase (cytochrome c)